VLASQVDVKPLLAFTTSVLRGLHGVLKCDSHHSECHRLIQAFGSLRSEYEAARYLDQQQRLRKRDELDTKFAQLIKNGYCDAGKFGGYERADLALE
jgi:hypothetical protein